MSNSSDQIIDDLLIGSDDLHDFSLSDPSQLMEDLAMMISPFFVPPDLNMGTPSPSSSGIGSDSNDQESLSNIAPPANIQSNTTRLKIIAQPYYGGKLRYRSEFDNNINRLGVLKNRNKESNFQGPAILIPEEYGKPNDGYYIRISLVTVTYNKTNLHYFHPYELEHPTNKHSNDAYNNAVWLPIQPEDCLSGTKSFPSLRIVKKRACHLQTCSNLRIFDCHNQTLQNNSFAQFSRAKDIIDEYNLDKSQLAFTVAKKVSTDGQTMFQLYPDTTVYSEEMVEGVDIESTVDNSIHSTTAKTNSSTSNCRVYKYAPKWGYDTSNEDMLIFLTNKLEPKKYGELKITFECDLPNNHWSQSIDNIDIKDRMISFKTPAFPYPFEMVRQVNVILKQSNRTLGTLTYYYMSALNQCSRCQSNAVDNRTDLVPNVPNKRLNSMIIMHDSENDSLVPDSKNSDKFQQSLSEPESSLSTVTTSNFASLPSLHIDQTSKDINEKLIEKLYAATELLFLNNDYTPLLRICRSFVKKRPQLLHDALIKNHSDLLLKFIPIASIDILQQKNELNETFLLHALRLNRIEIIQALLERNNSEELIEYIDEKRNNIFHLITSYSISSEALDLLINYLHEKSISIQEKFDYVNQDYQTPLQLAICNNNLLVTKSLLQYFNTNIHEIKNRTGDNLIHLAVRHGDLAMVKCLIEEGKLIKQGNQSNLTMTPSELARSLKHHDIMKYLNETYPQEDIDDDDDDDTSSDDN
ncbi:unnamed protein product [Rotaria sp. Silwood1]|nr:unnamed protein product [Rotaria sp. Silwood1]CAF3347661.1 unnamed protein product [Rotaria sp. Silwood1]CAF4512300.1 unnamed protein product [Rotaria sp. Silwood1]